MVFPDLRVEIQAGGIWTDITADTYTTRQQVTISRGRADEGARSDPAHCQLGLNNRDGRYTPKHPLSPYFGLIGRNTPIRVSVGGATPRLVLDGSATGYASTPDAPALDITGDLDLRCEAELDWTASDLAQVLLGKWDGATNQRSFVLRVLGGRLLLDWAPDGVTTRSATVTLPTLPDRAAVRAVLDADNGAGGCSVTFYWARALGGPWVQVGSPITQAGATSIFSGTAPLGVGLPDPTTTPAGVPFTGSGYRCEVRNGINGAVVASPDFTSQSPGARSFTDAAGCTWTLQPPAAISDRLTRFVGEVSSWPSRWGVAGQDVWVPLEASGITRRLGQGVKPLASTLRRRIPSEPNLLAYWPMEESRDATQAYSPIPGVQPLIVSGVEFAAVDTLAGSSPLPKIGPATTLGGQVPAGPNGAWRIECVYQLDQMPATTFTLMEISTSGGTYSRIQVVMTPLAIRLYGVSGQAAPTQLLSVLATDFLTTWNRLQIRAETVGGSTTFHLNWVTIGGADRGLSNTIASVTAGRVTALSVAPGVALDQRTLYMGHLSVMSVLDSPIYNFADHGFTRESASGRVRRLSQEEAVPVVISGAARDTPTMGAQRPAALLDLLQQAADTDGGTLGEARDRLALRYRVRAGLYSQPPALQLDYTAPGLAPPLEPLDDDSGVRNDVTVNRIGGSSARAVAESGPLSVQPPPYGVGTYDESVDLSLADDTQAEPIAYWRLWQGTQDEIRYPSVHVNVADAPHLLEDAAAVVEGSRITIANPPPWLPPSTLDLLVQGYTEVFQPYKWDITFQCSPARPWNVAVASDDGAVIREDFEDTAYALSIASGGTLPWPRTSAQAHEGTWSLRSGAVSNNQTSDAVVTLPPGATSLSFWYRVSSEASGAGFEGDRLLVLRDGVQLLRAQGAVEWTPYTLDVTGAGTVTFRYVKDNSTGAGEDAAYIDDLAIVVPPTDAGPLSVADTDGSELAAAVGPADTVLPVDVTSGPPWPTGPDFAPVDVVLGGEQVTVTAVTGTTSPQILTVTRAVNGITKAHPAGTAVSLPHPAIAAL